MPSLKPHRSAEAPQAAIAEEFAFFGDWTERYQYLIDLGRKLPPFPDALKTDAYKVTGCQSLVWLVAVGRCASASISRRSAIRRSFPGLIALLLRVYSGRSAAEILATEPNSSKRSACQASVADALERACGDAGGDQAACAGGAWRAGN